MIYVIGSNSYIGKKISHMFNKKEIKKISTKAGKNIIKTNIFNKKCDDKWQKKINDDDVIFFMSSFGSMLSHKKNKKKITNKIKNLEKNFFKKINSNPKIVFFSSDMVYDGEKKYYKNNDKTNPLNDYGKTKVKIENLVKKYFKSYLILRLPKIYTKSPEDKIFPFTDIKKVKQKKIIKIYDDNLNHYLNIKILMKFLSLKKIIKKNFIGTFNISDNKLSSRYDFITEFIKKNNYNLKLISYIKKISYKVSKVKIPKQVVYFNNKKKILNICPIIFIT